MSGKREAEVDDDEKFTPRNWKQLSKKDVQKLDTIERSRYLAYEPPEKAVADSIAAARKRLHELKKSCKQSRHQMNNQMTEEREKERHTKLIGQLKAAEGRNRIRLMRIRYENNKASEINHLISCQPSALRAVRLQSLVPPRPEQIRIRDLLGKDERQRVDALLEDSIGVETGRILS